MRVTRRHLQRGVTQQCHDVPHALPSPSDELQTYDGDRETEGPRSSPPQKGRSPAALAFRAAQVVLRTHALFSDQLLQNLLESSTEAGRSASELHHLFPTTWLHSQGIQDRRIINQVANLADVGWHENSVIGNRSPADYVPRLRDRLGIDDDHWARACAEHGLPPGWESMKYLDFLRERRRRMADIIRVAFRQLGGEADAPPLSPPWFLPGSEAVWKRIAEAERALRGVVREVYGKCFGDHAAQKIEDSLPERERESLSRALRARPAAAEALSVVDYLYLGQLPNLLFAQDVWHEARSHFKEAQDVKQRLQTAVKPNRTCPKRDCACPRGRSRSPSSCGLSMQ